jgi:hypothetical protein
MQAHSRLEDFRVSRSQGRCKGIYVRVFGSRFTPLTGLGFIVSRAWCLGYQV